MLKHFYPFLSLQIQMGITARWNSNKTLLMIFCTHGTVIYRLIDVNHRIFTTITLQYTIVTDYSTVLCSAVKDHLYPHQFTGVTSLECCYYRGYYNIAIDHLSEQLLSKQSACQWWLGRLRQLLNILCSEYI